MDPRTCGPLLAIVLGLSDTFAAAPWRLPQQLDYLSRCGAIKWSPLAATEPGFAEAHLVAAKLRAIGVSVGCIAPSKMTNWFEGQEGAAVFDTDVGRFDILFLPSGRTFDPLKVVVKEVEGGYHYSIESTLPGRPPRIESPRRIYFSPHGNKLVITRDAELLPRIMSALENRRGQ